MVLGELTIHDQARADFEAMFRPEPLHPKLARFVVPLSKGMQALKHPLVYDVPYIGVINARLNKRLELMLADVKKADAARAVGRYVFLHERPWRLQAFTTYLKRHKLCDAMYWETLGSIWTDSENIWQHLTLWKSLLRSTRKYRECFMDDADREEFAKLKHKHSLLPMTLYRGYQPGKNRHGLSWTLDRKKARMFANRFNIVPGRIVKRQVLANECFAYLGGRDEKELLILD